MNKSNLTTEKLEEKILEIAAGNKTSIEKEHEIKVLVKSAKTNLKGDGEQVEQLLNTTINMLKLEERVKHFGMKKLLDIKLSRFENVLTEEVKISEDDKKALKHIYIDERGYFHIHSSEGWVNPAIEKISKIKIESGMLIFIIENNEGIETEEKVMYPRGNKFLRTFSKNKISLT